MSLFFYQLPRVSSVLDEEMQMNAIPSSKQGIDEVESDEIAISR